MQNIIYVVTKSNWGGAQRYVYDLATHLPKDAFRATVAFGQPGRLAEELQRANIGTHSIFSLQRDLSLRADIQAFFELLRLFNQERPDIVHLNSSKAAGLGGIAARIAGVPRIVFTVHGWPFWEARSGIARAIIFLLSWLTAACAHVTICISDHDLAVAQRMPLVGHKAVRVYNGIEPIDFLPTEPHGGDVRVLTNAELTPNKNLFVGIDAIAAARAAGIPISYSIMGAGELKQALENYIRKHTYGAFVTLLGFVPEGARHYKKFDIFFLPSKKEGVPYVLLEAGQAALPVLASRAGGIPEVVDDQQSGLLCDANDTHGFTERLVQLARDSELRKNLGNTLAQRVAETFSFSGMIEETIRHYRS